MASLTCRLAIRAVIDPSTPDLAGRAIEALALWNQPRASAAITRGADYLRRTGGETGSLEILTPRQREILQLIAEGQTTKQIAHTLHISIKTVETHRMQLMERLDIHDVAGLVRYAIRIGLVKTDE